MRLIVLIRTDYIAPFNPRGDAYQSPSSSSSGSAAAQAAYPWIDFTIATDTGGSIRHPAGVCGVYGMRTSTGLISTRGIYSVSPLLDTVGVFTRSALMMERVVECMIDQPSRSQNRLSLPMDYKLLYPVRAKAAEANRWFPFPDEAGEMADVEVLFEETVRAIESQLGCKRSPFNLDELWRTTRPGGQSESLDEATGNIYTALTTHACVRGTIDPFISDFKAANQGRSPFIDPIVKARQQRGREITALENRTAAESAMIFSQWVRDTLFATVGSDRKRQFPLLIFPQSWGTPDYRNDPDRGPLLFSSFSAFSLSYLSGCPDCTVPIGEVPSISHHTESEMLLPVSLSVLGPPGSDLTLLALLSDLERKGVLRPVKTGRSMYHE